MTSQTQGPDIANVLEFWEGQDGVPKELSEYLSLAADEIRDLREENFHLRKVMEDAGPKF